VSWSEEFYKKTVIYIYIYIYIYTHQCCASKYILNVYVCEIQNGTI
jgi:hypothetical protein